MSAVLLRPRGIRLTGSPVPPRTGHGQGRGAYGGRSCRARRPPGSAPWRAKRTFRHHTGCQARRLRAVTPPRLALA